MHFQTTYSGNRVDSNFCRVIKSRNELQIKRIEYLNGKYKDQWILLLESDLPLDQDVKAFIEEDTLIIEASHSLEFDKPFRSHLFESDRLSENEQGGLEIVFSELKLNHGYNYDIVSYQVINSRLIKIILSFQPVKEYN